VRASSPFIIAVAVVALAGCPTKAPRDDPARLVSLRDPYESLHERLEKTAAKEPLVASALADRGQVVLTMRSGLIEELAGNVARHCLDRVTVDLSEVEGHSSGELRKKTLFGRVKVGEWSVSVDLGSLRGYLRAGTPRVSLRGPDLIDIELPVDVRETEGDATLRFGWDSSGLANVVCKDFELTREIRGRVLAQRHLVSGALRLHNTGESLTATPVFPDRRIRLRLDLTARSWGVVEAALRSRDTTPGAADSTQPRRRLGSVARVLLSRGSGGSDALLVSPVPARRGRDRPRVGVPRAHTGPAGPARGPVGAAYRKRNAGSVRDGGGNDPRETLRLGFQRR
jgi:hypothetical protein